MPAHPDFVAAFREGLHSGQLPEGLTARDPSEAARRFGVYQNNVSHSLTTALATRFPVVARLVGAPFFGAMAQVFIRAHPPRSPLIHAYGAEMAPFLAGFSPVAHLPYLPDVARLEFLRGEAYHAADHRELTQGAFQTAAVGGAALRLAPSCRLFETTTGAWTIWQAHRHDPPEAIRFSADTWEGALIARGADLNVAEIVLNRSEFAFCNALQHAAPLGRAAQAALDYDATFDLTALLVKLLSLSVFSAQEDFA